MPATTKTIEIFNQTGWAVARLSGKDRVKSLNNLCTQDIKKLAEGTVTEGFITNPQGKTSGFVTIFELDQAIWVRTNPAGLKEALPLFQKYAIFDDTTVEEMTETLEQCLLLGTDLRKVLQKHFTIELPDRADFAITADLGTMKNVTLLSDQTTADGGIVILGPKGLNDFILNALASESGGRFSDDNAWDLRRLRHGWPLYGTDIKPDQLPQEVDRDRSAINFNKGCYLGQETVARLDALGHVNRLLMGFTWQPGDGLNSELKPPLEIHNAENQNVGEIRSMNFDESSHTCIGLALVRTKALTGALHVKDCPAGEIKFYRLEQWQRLNAV